MSGIFTALDVSASAMTANRRRMELLVTNIANSQTTRTAQGGPYQRKDVVFMSTPMPSFGEIFSHLIEEEGPLEGVRISEVVVTEAEPILRHEPNHPDADERGFVAYPNINPIQEMANLMAATRTYEANVRAFQAVKEIVQRSIDLGRRG